MAPVDREQILRQASPNPAATHPGRHLANRGERHLVVLWRHRATVDAQAGCLGLSIGGPDQPRLAEPGLPARKMALPRP